MGRYNRNESLKYYIVAGAVMALLILYFGVFGGGGKMTQVIFASSAFWALTIFSLAIGVAVKLKHPRHFTWPEYVLYIMWCLVVMCALYAMAFRTSTDLVRTEIWNGKAVSARYQEQHTDEKTETRTDSKGKTSTRRVRSTHYAEYNVSTTAGDYAGNSTVYRNYVSTWGNESRSFGSCMDATGPFFVHTTTFPGDDAKLIPVAIEHDYVNFVTASDSIKKLQGLVTESYAKLLVSHPRSFDGAYGETEIDRVVVAGATVPDAWKQSVDGLLDRELAELGPSKQCNIVVYVAGTSDQSFAHALEESWKLGEKNDIIVVVGASHFPTVDWVYIMAWTDVEEFKITLRNVVLDAKAGVADPATFVRLITSQVRQPVTAGGYKRKSMADYDYLISEISLPWWASLMIVLFGSLMQFGAAVLLINNEIEA
jgi:hypothetical protein